MKWRTILAVGAVLLMLVLQFRQPGAAYACMCQNPSIEADFEQSDTVFQGKAVSIKRLNQDQADVTFDVSIAWKGGARTVVVRQGNGGSCTDYPFAEGSEYIVFAHDGWTGRSDTTLYASTCGVTASASSDMRVALKRFQPEPQSLNGAPLPDDQTLPWGWLLLAAGALAAAIWRWRLRRA